MDGSQRFFYCTARPMQVGDISRPGNWGRILQTYTPQSSPNAWPLVRELTYEIVRARDFPQKPSRLECNFVCMSESDLNEFRISTKRNDDTGFEVALIEPNALSHVGDWTLLNTLSTDDLGVFVNRATLYWQGTNIVKEELVTLSPLEITRVLLASGTINGRR